VALTLLLILAAGQPAHATGKLSCSNGRGRASKRVAGFEIKIFPNPDKTDIYDPECLAVVLDAKNNKVFSEGDWGFSIEVAGDDVNGDGIPDIVLEADSGGAHCCWTYYIISLGPKPGLIKKFENDRDASFFWDKERRRMEIAALDGAFDYFDGLCHACTPFPVVYLRLDGTTLVDISPEYVSNYDEIINDNKKKLTAEDLLRLKTQRKPTGGDDLRETVRGALMIVFAYLYSGREAQAHEALQNMWPASDQARMWNLILETRRNGILCYTRKDAACGTDASGEISN
jgi:hypothetical protein